MARVNFLLVKATRTAPAVFPVVLAGFCAFLNLFVTQPILPLLASVFHASKAAVSLTVTAATFGVAIAAPFAGLIADRIGRKRVIVWSAVLVGITTLFGATAHTLNWLIFWRFLQGLATPGVFAVTVAYVNDEWPAERAASAVGNYVSGTVLGGFSGRVLAGLLSEYLSWQWSFVVVGLLILGIAGILARGLRAEENFARANERSKFILHTLGHLRNPQLLATYAGGFCVLFTMVALFTYVTFHLAAPPFLLSPGWLGSIFGVYLVGAAVTPLAGLGIDRFGHRNAVLGAACLGVAGALAALAPNLWWILFGLTLCSCGVFIAQSAAVSYIGTVAEHSRALAVGVYVSFYYTGGSFGSSAPGWLWETYGWPGCVGLIVFVQTVLAMIAIFGWKTRVTSVYSPIAR
jgi:MFS transporter, YNFM family, putative membrane transport protein